MTKQTRLGACYYPEQWDEALWAEDAARMAALGLKKIRIGEFAWSFIEPSDGDYRWDWLDRAIDCLANEGLEIILGTPTATPPKWLVDKFPEILAHDKQGRPRRFGSRRHYCFSSPAWRAESARIVTQMTARYGAHPAVIAWQTDNEYGCHDTVRSYSPAAAGAFRLWLKQKYGAPEQLNKAWGCAFWSQLYQDFSEVDLPNLTVTEPNPSHVLDFYRFSSDQVISYNRLQTDIIRKYAPGRDIVHNFMGFFTDFDHFALSDDLDMASWDSYPLGFLDMGPFAPADKDRYRRQGHPDIAGFHHDLYRACGRGRWAVMEQQPGPVNWAAHNPAPRAGMVRAWTHEAHAHGAEFVSYFRWRQAPFAQEQMHAGLLRPDNQPAPAFSEVEQCASEIAALSAKPAATAGRADVALIFSYEAQWMFEAQPQGAAWSYLALCFQCYSALRSFGLNVDFAAPGQKLDAYKLVVAPSLPHVNEAMLARLKETKAQILLGPRSGAKTENMQIPDSLAPGPLQSLLPLKVTHSESFPSCDGMSVSFKDAAYGAGGWLDHVETRLAPVAQTSDGAGALYNQKNLWLLTTLPDEAFLNAILTALMKKAGIKARALPPGLRTSHHGGRCYAFNYGPAPITLSDHLAPPDGAYLLGEKTLPPAGVACWEEE